MTLVYSVVLVWEALQFPAMVIEDWVGKFQHMAWRIEILLVVLVVAQVAAWRGWFWPLRLFLHAAWIIFFVYALVLLDEYTSAKSRDERRVSINH